jgi:hypothetical protein
VYKDIPKQKDPLTGRGSIFGSKTQDQGAIVERATKCLADRMATLPQDPGPNASPAALHDWCCSLKAALRENLIDYPTYDCQLAEALANLPCPDPNDSQFANNPNAYRAAIDEVRQSVALIGGQYLIYCICAALLPPCPPIVCDPRVPLATVTVKKDANGRCRVIRICNIGPRKFVTTFVSLGYWLSFLSPLLALLRKGLEFICCQFRFRPQQAPANTNPGVPPSFNAATSAPSSTSIPRAKSAPSTTNKRGFKAYAGQVWANRSRRVDAQTLFLGAIGSRDENGNPYLADTELANPFHTLMVNNLAGPLLAKLPDNSLDMLKRAGSTLTTGGAPRKAAAESGSEDAINRIRDRELGELIDRVSILQTTVELQSETINELRRRVENM